MGIAGLGMRLSAEGVTECAREKKSCYGTNGRQDHEGQTSMFTESYAVNLLGEEPQSGTAA